MLEKWKSKFIVDKSLFMKANTVNFYIGSTALYAARCRVYKCRLTSL